MLPLKTTLQDLDILSSFLNTQVGWVSIAKIKQTVDPKHGDNRKIEAMRRIGLIDRDGQNVKLTAEGRTYAAGDGEARAAILQASLRAFPLYKATLDWMFWNKKSDSPTRTEVANYWHDHHSSLLEKAQGSALTDAVVFFLRLVGAAGLGKFEPAGNGRPTTLIQLHRSVLDAFIAEGQSQGAKGEVTPEGEAPAEDSGKPATGEPEGKQPSTPPAPTPGVPAVTPTVQVSASPAVHINVEIHIAADAKPDTVAEIFKNMRKYVLNSPASDSES